MSSYKYPYIPDKTMYAAVMGACRWIREDGYFNKAVSYYADKYGVDPDELAKHIRARQGAGQKAKKTEPRKYYWFAVEYSYENERYCNEYADYGVVKGTTESNVIKNMTKYEDPCNEYEPHKWFGRIERFESKTEAEEKVAEWEEANEKEKKRIVESLNQ